MVNYSPVKLIEFVRDELVEQEHFGFLVKVSPDKTIKTGDDKNYPFYLRSCAKPLQAALIIDFGLDKYYKMTSEEIAVCCASHAGEACHTDAVKSLLNKIGLDESYLKCGFHKPLSKKEQEKLVISGEKESIFQNNCSGKHVMMLGICLKNSWEWVNGDKYVNDGANNYTNLNHPLQIAIKNKIYELCEIKENYPVTKDGCGVPIHSMPLENMVKGYLNLFLSEKYKKIRDAFSKHPYIIGGEDRLDTAIMSANNRLIAKVGAGGLCIVVNLETQEGLIIKIMDCDMKARAICLIETLHKINWLDDNMMENELILNQNKKDILTLHKEKVGSANVLFAGRG